ncbi:MAG: ATP-binding protein [Chitinophagales bacterium]
MILSVKVNESLFSHVIHNLIHNACKFSKKGDIITINAKVVDQNNTTISIIDSGIGFEPSAAEDIFNKFTKKGQVGTSGESSTGLGLYVSKTITNKHAGSITTFSKIKIGLPLR